MQKIIPCLWFDNQAEEAVKFYTSIFKNSKTGTTTRYDKASAEVSGQKEGSVLTVEFEIEGEEFLALNGGPLFKFTPAISFSIACETEEEVDEIHSKLREGGADLMPLNRYPFSKKYAWIVDKYGLSWQINLVKAPRKITPTLLFTQDKAGKADEAIKFYTSLFENSKVETISRYEKGEGDREGDIKYSLFTLAGEYFSAQESSLDHKFTFTEAISLIVNCGSQEEVDKFWNALSAVPESEQCGWLKDKYGVSWQIVPTILNKLLSDPDPAKAGRAMQAMLEMKKLVIEELKKAHEGK